MKYAAYSEYKTSGSNWLDAVPSHWNVKPLKLIVKMPITDGPHETPEFTPDGVPFASVEAVWDGKVHLSSVRGYISEEDHRRYGKKYHPKRGDIFIVKSGSTTGKIAIVDFDDDFNVWSPLAAVRCDASQAHPEFVFYALSSSYFQRLVQVSWSFGTQPNIGMGVLGNLPAVLPPPAEQQTIARFLDAKTAQIDALVAQKRQLIDKLKEKRQALIARTVIRGIPPEAAKAAGLEPSPEMKDSGVDWLGRVPADWVITAVWHQFFLGRGRVISHEDISENPGPYPVYSSQTENDGVLGYLGSFDFDGDYITWTTDGANAGTVFTRSGKFNCTNVCGTLKAKHPNRIDNRYVTYALSIATAEFVRHDINPKLMNNVMKSIRFALPSKIEQAAIADYLDTELQKLESLGMEIVVAVDRLTEYRQALITSAVTGKIDVRELA